MSNNMASNIQVHSWTRFVIPLLLLFTSLILLISIGASASRDLEWIEDRSNIHNTGLVNGTGLMFNLDKNYSVYLENDQFRSGLISVDISKNGSSEIIYTTLNGTLSIRKGDDGSLLMEKEFYGKFVVPPMVHHLDGKKGLDLIVINRNATRGVSTVYFLAGSDLREIEKITIPEIPYAGGKIYDVDNDGIDELLLTTLQGYVYCIDLETYMIDWQTFIHMGLIEPVAIFLNGTIPKVAVTSGIYFGGTGALGTGTFYVLNGSDGDIEWTFDSGESYISTPPTVIVDHSEGPLIAFANYFGNVFVLDYNDRSTYLRIDNSSFERHPYWFHADYIDASRSGGPLLILQGRYGCASIDLDGKKVVWSEWYDYQTRREDSLCADIDNDGRVEFILIGKQVEIWNISTGKVELVYTDYTDRPLTLRISDFDTDGFLELCIIFDGWFRVYDADLMFRYKGASLDGSNLQNGSMLITYAMYREYAMVLRFESSTTNLVKTVELTFDPAHAAITTLFDVSYGSFTEPNPRYIVVTGVHVSIDNNEWELHVRYFVNWTFPHEDFFGVECSIELLDLNQRNTILVDLFRVENDVVLSGTLVRTYRGSQVSEDEWLTPIHTLTGTGLQVTYEGDETKAPPSHYFELEVLCGVSRWQVDLGPASEIDLSLDLGNLTTGSYMARIEFLLHPDPIETSAYSFQMKIDSDPVEIVSLYPDEFKWIAGGPLLIGVIASDSNGSGIDPSTVQVKMAIEDIFDTQGTWLDYEVMNVLGDGTFEFSRIYSVTQGLYMFQWRMSDIAGNPQTLSEVSRITIDESLVRFHDQFPNDWVTTRSVEVGITIDINVSYNDPTIWYAKGSNPNTLDEWMEYVAGGTVQGTLTASLELDFEEGDDNYIQWKAVLNETTSILSSVYQVLVDTLKPVFGAPDPDLKQTFSTSTMEISIPVFDDGSGVDSTSVAYQFSSSDSFEDAMWEKAGTEVDGDRTLAKVTLMDMEGKSNFIRFRAKDVAGNPLVISDVYRIKMNEPPLVESKFPQNGTRFKSGEEIDFIASIIDPDPDDVITVEWISDIDGRLGSGAELTEGNLSVGIHKITIRFSDNAGHDGELSLVVHIDAPDDPDKTMRITDEPLLLLLIIIVMILVSVLFIGLWMNRK